MNIKNRLVAAVSVLLMLVACAFETGCAGRLSQIEHQQTIDRKDIANNNLALQHHSKCKEQAEAFGVPIYTFDGCQRYGNPRYYDRDDFLERDDSRYVRPRRRFEPYYEYERRNGG